MASGEAIDAYIEAKLLGPDPVLVAALAANQAAGLPAIDVSPAQGKMLNLLVRIAGAKRILEIGTLGGYSTIWLACALPEGGKLVTLELEARHAESRAPISPPRGLPTRSRFMSGRQSIRSTH